MTIVRISIFEDRRTATDRTARSGRPYEVVESKTENRRHELARMIARELGVLISTRLVEGREGVVEFEARRPRREAGPYSFWRRAVVEVVNGHTYEARILARFIPESLDMPPVAHIAK